MSAPLQGRRVLADYHHNDLWESLELLCDRLGFQLYRPIGMEWWDEGYNNHDRFYRTVQRIEPVDGVARQYLEPWGSDRPIGGHGATSWREDTFHPGRVERLVTLERARDLIGPGDIVISSLAHNHEGFARFASEVGATFGLQIGNVRFSEADMAEDRWDLAAFGLVSGFMPAPPPKPHVVYHQEFSLRSDPILLHKGFYYEPPPRGLSMVGLTVDGESHSWEEGPFRVSSFVQCYPQDGAAYTYWQAAAPFAPEMRWNVFGAYGEAVPDQYEAGNISTCSGVARAMRASDVGWHAKRWSDGYGHVIHNWFATGRPVFGFQRYYADQMAGPLWQEGVTSFDIETKTAPEVVAIMRRLRDDEDYHIRMCEAAAARFREIVDFDYEEGEIRKLLERVLP